jgi:hypothetical protein
VLAIDAKSAPSDSRDRECQSENDDAALAANFGIAVMSKTEKRQHHAAEKAKKKGQSAFQRRRAARDKWSLAKYLKK